LGKNEPNDDLSVNWSSRWSLTGRILAVNIFALALLAGGFFYLDSFRVRILDQRSTMVLNQTRLVAAALERVPPDRVASLLIHAGDTTDQRFRLYGPDGTKRLDSWKVGPPTYELRDPTTEEWQRHVARFLDKTIDHIVDAERYPDFAEPAVDRAQSWPEVVSAARLGRMTFSVRRAPDRTPVLAAAIPVGGSSAGVLLTTLNARDVIRSVRAERFRLGMVLAAAITLSILLSLFLARTIVRPLRRLARAAQRVRQGRAREVQVPRLPSRRDEIGRLARAVSDMSLALRRRIDATEAFAADVSHELKNPLASLRSAVDTLVMVKEPELQQKLIDVIRDDVVRLDRLITDISDAARADAELSRVNFEPIDVGVMLQNLVKVREERGRNMGIRMAFARPRLGTTVVMGEASRLTRAIENLIDNAVSFSPPGGLVEIGATRVEDEVLIRIEDEGPGVPPEAREEIFNRFHSLRPDNDAFGKHSGLGLAIARTIIDGHGGRIMVQDKESGGKGACFLIRMPFKAPE
jgi:two-component system, OmpR family, sensor histidine kinase ChvG